VLATPAAAALSWRLVARGPAESSGPPGTAAFVALTRAATAPFAARLPQSAAGKLAAVDFTRNALVAVFGEFGCQDGLISVDAIAQRGTSIAIGLVQRSPKPGTATCMAIFPTFRLLTVAKASLHRPYPTRATVTLARA
jgi:hypothetical protein